MRSLDWHAVSPDEGFAARGTGDRHLIYTEYGADLKAGVRRGAYPSSPGKGVVDASVLASICRRDASQFSKQDPVALGPPTMKARHPHSGMPSPEMHAVAFVEQAASV